MIDKKLEMDRIETALKDEFAVGDAVGGMCSGWLSALLRLGRVLAARCRGLLPPLACP